MTIPDIVSDIDLIKAALEDAVLNSTEDLTDLYTQVANLCTLIMELGDELETITSGNTSAINSNVTAIGVLASEVDVLEGSTSGLTTRVTDLEITSADLVSRMADVENTETKSPNFFTPIISGGSRTRGR